MVTELDSFGFDIKYTHFSTSKSGHRRKYKPTFFRHMADLLGEGLENSRFSLSSIQDTSTKQIYSSYMETVAPAQVEEKYIERDWKVIWARLYSGVLQPQS